MTLAFLVILETFIPAVGANGSDFGLVERYDRQALVYSFLIVMAILIYRRQFRWWWRLLMYAGFLVCCAIT